MTGLPKKRKIIISAVIVVIALLSAAFAVLQVMNAPVDKSDDEKIVITVEEGDTASDIAATLDENGLLKSKTAFKIKVKISGKADEFKTGTYAFDKTMSSAKMIEMIATGDTAGKIFQIEEGMQIYKIGSMLEERGICTADEFYNEVAHGEFDYDFLDGLAETENRLEGFLYPDTYEVPLDADAHDVVAAMLEEFDQKMEEEGVYDKAEEAGGDLYDYVIKASIAEKEASVSDERGNVISVINNRIESGMALQMDSTIVYANQEEKIRNTYSDIEIDSSYNTYKHKGLPIGPICSPTVDTILTAIDPPDTDYLYFIASPDMDGTNIFSETYEEFEKNKEAFDKAYEEYIEEHPDEE